jgi:hypothetical protein
MASADAGQSRLAARAGVRQRRGMAARNFLAIVTVAILIAIYGALYVAAVERDSGRARGAGGFFHYRTTTSDWEACVFIPAAFVESWLIRILPKSFLPHPSWADVPQLLILRSPDHVFRFHASWKQFAEE